jgi:hypothetical protein
VVELYGEDVARLLKLGPGEWVSGVQGEWARDAILIRIDGDETSSLPTCAEGMYPERVERPFAVVELRRRLLGILGRDQTAGETLVEIRSVLREELLPGSGT